MQPLMLEEKSPQAFRADYVTCARLVPYRGFSGDDDFVAQALQSKATISAMSLCLTNG